MQGSAARSTVPTAFRNVSPLCVGGQAAAFKPSHLGIQCSGGNGASSSSNPCTMEAAADGTITYRFFATAEVATQEAVPPGPSDGTQPRPALSQEQVQQPQPAKRRFQSSWDAKEAGGGSSPAADYLYEVGQSEVNMNIDTGQTSRNLDSLFTGNFLGHQSDIADGSLRDWEFRSLNNIVGDYYVAPKFLDAVAVHIAKNFLVDAGSFDSSTRVPLILGIWGGKGQGKSFQTELVFKKLGVEPIIMSAGELESDRAGEPGRLIRDRYRRAAELSRVRGKLSCLLINDIDAGVGIFENTQRTVNNQMVVGSLMSICDNPNHVTLYNVEWRGEDRINRIPIIVTGNDFSTLFAPLIRDGRMEKFYWHPTRADLTAIVLQMYKDDGIGREDVGALIDAFPGQSLDFFGALRASMYDGQIREWIKRDVIHGEISDENANLKDLGRRLVRQQDLPEFKPQVLTVLGLLAEGRRLVHEQDMVMSMRLSQEYYKRNAAVGGLIGLSG